jgi:hypothetical protein
MPLDASLDRQEFNITESVCVMLYHQMTQCIGRMQRQSRHARPNTSGTAIKPVSNPLYRLTDTPGPGAPPPRKPLSRRPAPA